MAKKIRVFNDAEDKNVAAIVVFMGDNNAYFYDEAHTVSVPEDDYFNLFFKGAVFVNEDDEFSRPIGFADGAFVFATSASAEEGSL